jgi:lysophospholipase L1-like esterase
MNHLVCFVVTYFLIFSTVCHAQTGQWQAADCGFNDPAVIMCMGDSITTGVTWINSDDNIYPVLLAALTRKTVVNKALSGSRDARSSYGVENLNDFLHSEQPRIVTILYGVNDLIRGERVSIVADNLRKMVVATKNNKSFPVLATLTPVFGDKYGHLESSVKELNVKIRDIVREEGIELADLEKAFNWRSRYFQEDGLHPDDDGMAIIAKTFHETIGRIPTCRYVPKGLMLLLLDE